MKKTVYMSLVFCLMILLVSCSMPNDDFSSYKTPYSESQFSTPSIVGEASSGEGEDAHPSSNAYEGSSSLPVYVPGSIKILPKEEVDFADTFDPHFRQAYYVLHDVYLDLVPEDEANSFLNAWDDACDYEEDPAQMILVEFIKKFNIPRDQFDAATKKFISTSNELNLDMTEEMYEVPNGDIIYTFDYDIIKAYYARK